MKNPPRLRFANLPTPVEYLPRLSAALGGPRLLVKRDDLTGLALGGNKTRKLEFLLAAAQADGARTIITAGAVQSNHCRQTAAAAARLGFECILVLAGDRPDGISANLLLDNLFNARIVWSDLARRDETLNQVFDQAWADGKRPYLVPYGGSNAVGAMGYVFAVEEFVRQGIEADWIVFATSSGGTQAGLVLGAQMFGFKGKILGISVDEPKDALESGVMALAVETAEYLSEKIEPGKFNIQVNADYCSAGYGVFTAAEREALHLFARHEGLLLDPVYTGRAAAGMVDLIRSGFFKSNETVLFWHTGGTPALFADKYQADIVR